MNPPKHTPWGHADHITILADGIASVSTSSHGGIWLSEERWAQLTAKFPMVQSWAGEGWLEEDCDWCVAALAFPEFFSENDRAVAEQTAKGWKPELWEHWSGRKLAPGESHVKDERAFFAAHQGRLLVRAAWGDWKAGVPKGFVGVVARAIPAGMKQSWQIASSSTRSTVEKWFLVPEAEYQARGPHGFLIEPHHREVPDFTQAQAA